MVWELDVGMVAISPFAFSSSLLEFLQRISQCVVNPSFAANAIYLGLAMLLVKHL